MFLDIKLHDICFLKMYYTIKIDMKCNYLNFNVFLDVLK